MICLSCVSLDCVDGNACINVNTFVTDTDTYVQNTIRTKRM